MDIGQLITLVLMLMFAAYICLGKSNEYRNAIISLFNIVDVS